MMRRARGERSQKRGGVARAAPALSRAIEEHGNLLFYDGHCGLCNGVVSWILRRDPEGTMRFATLQGRYGDEARAALPALNGIDSIVVLHKEGAWTQSTAVMEIGRYLGGVWSAATIGYVIPRVVRDWLYSLVARVRYRVFGRSDTCQIPPASTRHRFLD